MSEVKLIRFNSIPLFEKMLRGVRAQAQFHGKKLPVVMVKGRVKINGTNRSIVFTGPNCENHYFQTRENVFTEFNKHVDHHGFAKYVTETPGVLEWLREMAQILREDSDNKNDPVQIYGEWAGRGICGKVDNVIEHFTEPHFFIIGARISDNNEKAEFLPMPPSWVPIASQDRRLIIMDEVFKPAYAEIDLNEPERGIEQVNKLTLEEEDNSILAQMFFAESFEYRVGEGFVWELNEVIGGEDYLQVTAADVRFKTKGSRHKRGKCTAIALADPERVNSIEEFLDKVLDGRLDQGLAILTEKGLDPKDRKNFITYVRWILDDIEREEDGVMASAGIQMSDISKGVGQAANTHFLANIKGTL